MYWVLGGEVSSDGQAYLPNWNGRSRLPVVSRRVGEISAVPKLREYRLPMDVARSSTEGCDHGHGQQ